MNLRRACDEIDTLLAEFGEPPARLRDRCTRARACPAGRETFSSPPF
jgi:hypothetical protein